MSILSLSNKKFISQNPYNPHRYCSKLENFTKSNNNTKIQINSINFLLKSTLNFLIKTLFNMHKFNFLWEISLKSQKETRDPYHVFKNA